MGRRLRRKQNPGPLGSGKVRNASGRERQRERALQESTNQWERKKKEEAIKGGRILQPIMISKNWEDETAVKSGERGSGCPGTGRGANYRPQGGGEKDGMTGPRLPHTRWSDGVGLSGRGNRGREGGLVVLEGKNAEWGDRDEQSNLH